ncbi:MAG: hypothetical protein Q8862_07545 [Bacteroidota bacterium]|nr:hypothetical protein [Bacteroidota bacterium]
MKWKKYIVIGGILLFLGIGTCVSAYIYRNQGKQLFEHWYQHGNDINAPEYIKADHILRTGRTINTIGVFVGLAGAIFVYAGVLVRKNELE